MPGKLLNIASWKNTLAAFTLIYIFEGDLISGSKTRVYAFSCFVKLHAQLLSQFSFLVMLSSF